MKVWSTESVFDEPWDIVVKATWRKYPNKFSNSVEALDVIDRHVDKRGVLKSHRLMTTRWPMPGWVESLLGTTLSYASEHSEVDRRRKTMILTTRNLSFCSLMTMEEQLVYSQHKEDKNKTVLRQETLVKVQGMPLSSYLEKLVQDTCEKNATKGRQAMEHTIQKIKQEALDAVQTIDNVFSMPKQPSL